MSRSDPSLDRPPSLLQELKSEVGKLFRGPPEDPATRLLRKRKEKQRSLRKHIHTYLVVHAGLLAINLTTRSVASLSDLWVIYPAIGWGMGLALHILTTRGWLEDQEEALAQAERQAALGRLAAPAPTWAPGQATPRLVDARAIAESCQKAVAGALAAYAKTELSPEARAELEAQLKDGLRSAHELLSAASRIETAIAEVAPEGLAGIEATIKKLEAEQDTASDDGWGPRALWVARKEKVRHLLATRDRMLESAEAFLLAVENLRLDAAGPHPGRHGAGTLAEPARHLLEEVASIRRVERELRALD